MQEARGRDEQTYVWRFRFEEMRTHLTIKTDLSVQESGESEGILDLTRSRQLCRRCRQSHTPAGHLPQASDGAFHPIRHCDCRQLDKLSSGTGRLHLVCRSKIPEM